MNVACSRCGTPLSPAALSDAADRICPSCRAGIPKSAPTRASRWRTVSAGLKIQFAVVVFWTALASTAFLLRPLEIIGGNMLIYREAMMCGSAGTFCLYVLGLCLCGTVPDPAAQRSLLCCIFIGLFGSFGLALAWRIFMAVRAEARQPISEWMIPWAAGLSVFAVYYSAFVFLARFHARVAQAFGNRRLRVAAQVLAFVPIVAIVANILLNQLGSRVPIPRRAPPIFRNRYEIAQTAFDLGIAFCYAAIIWWTFRTIDFGDVVELRSDEDHDVEDSLG